MSSYQKIRHQKRKMKQETQVVKNDISNQEFDSYYQQCIQNKKQRLNQKKLLSQDDNEKLNQEEFSSCFSENNYQNWKETDQGNPYENYTDEEIDRAFEEAERWADF